jgi:ATP-dependent DNA helicase RecG
MKSSAIEDTVDAALKAALGNAQAAHRPNDVARQEFSNELRYLKGVGPKRAEAFFEAGFESLGDLAMHFPLRYLDARELVEIRDLHNHNKKLVSIRGHVISSQVTGHRKRFARIVIRDDSGGALPIVFFDYPDSRAKAFHVGDEFLFSGYVGSYRDTINLVQPPYVERLEPGELAEGRMLPLYSMPRPIREAGIRPKQFRELIRHAAEKLRDTPFYDEVLPAQLISGENLPERQTAILSLHQPSSPEELYHARRRMKFEEIFFVQLRLGVERRKVRRAIRGAVTFDVGSTMEALSSHEKTSKAGAAETVLAQLPFELTADQEKSLREILADMSKAGGRKYPMNRLLQGDVGSGKTIVALLAMLTAIDNGYQCAIMAPTEVLAAQHYHTISSLLKDTALSTVLLIGAQKKKEREFTLRAIATGAANIVVGTHALIQESVAFDRLGLVVTDEQHRFGVAQRKALIEKSFQTTSTDADLFVAGSIIRERISPDVLIMTATPIPRTLALTLYGDIDVSTIRQFPKDRKPIRTLLLYEHDLAKVYEAARKRIIGHAEQVFIVYPLREKSEKSDSEAAERAFELLRTGEFKDQRVALVHGKMPSAEKQQVMRAFREHEYDVLVGTTVIEVGVDVPNATVMIIRHAERFGIAQLHQLRGRVGRGPAPSACVLVASEKLVQESGNETSDQLEAASLALERLEVVASTTDGFVLAQEDMRIRGTGELMGLKQTGNVAMKVADLTKDIDIVEITYRSIESMLDRDPELRDATLLPVREHFLRLYHDAESFLNIG